MVAVNAVDRGIDCAVAGDGQAEDVPFRSIQGDDRLERNLNDLYLEISHAVVTFLDSPEGIAWRIDLLGLYIEQPGDSLDLLLVCIESKACCWRVKRQLNSQADVLLHQRKICQLLRVLSPDS